jgi:hypothetical protein
LDFGFWILDFGFWILDFGLRNAFAKATPTVRVLDTQCPLQEEA